MMKRQQLQLAGIRNNLFLLWVCCIPCCIQSFSIPTITTTTPTKLINEVTTTTTTMLYQSTITTDTTDIIVDNTHTDNTKEEEDPNVSPLSMSLSQLTSKMNGKGRAIAIWDCYRAGIDPLLYYDASVPEKKLDQSVFAALGDNNNNNNNVPLDEKRAKTTTREEMQTSLPTKRHTEGLGSSALRTLQTLSNGSIEDTIAKLSHIQTSLDGTTKLLVQMVEDGLEVETVIIPWEDRGRSTLCLSSQVGCRQGCTFCATGRMGRLRSLSSDEILAQVYYSRKVCRVLNIPPVDNVVFMGMGEPADNAIEVVRAAKLLTDGQGFQMAKTRVTISTVGPDPEAFGILGKAPVALAWSVHASEDSLRKQLVPTTKYSMVELRNGFTEAMLQRPKKLRTTMLEIALIDHVNDSPEDAEHLANFALDMVKQVPHMKLMVNLIPFNDIGHGTYKKPSNERVLAFQDVLTERGVFCFIRTTRGDDESAACGQLATKKQKKDKVAEVESEQ